MTLSRPGSDATNAPSDVTAYMSQIRGHPPHHHHHRHFHDHLHPHVHHRDHRQTLTNHCCNQKFYFSNLACCGLEIEPHLQYDPDVLLLDTAVKPLEYQV